MEKTSLNDFEWIDIKTSSKHTVFADFPCASAQREFDISLVMLNNLWPTVQLALADKKTDGTHTLGVQLGVLMAITDTIITMAITLISWDTTDRTPETMVIHIYKFYEYCRYSLSYIITFYCYQLSSSLLS